MLNDTDVPYTLTRIFEVPCLVFYNGDPVCPLQCSTSLALGAVVLLSHRVFRRATTTSNSAGSRKVGLRTPPPKKKYSLGITRTGLGCSMGCGACPFSIPCPAAALCRPLMGHRSRGEPGALDVLHRLLALQGAKGGFIGLRAYVP